MIESYKHNLVNHWVNWEYRGIDQTAGNDIVEYGKHGPGTNMCNRKI